MKIRKLILRAKLKQIENQNIFIFHCSTNATQWRFLKNFLYNESTKTRRAWRASFVPDPRLSFLDTTSSFYTENPVDPAIRFAIGAFGSFASERSSGGAFCGDPVASGRARRSAHSIYKPKGCLFIFASHLSNNENVFETHAARLRRLELVNKIESLDLNNNLILLYGQIDSTLLNHIDIKRSLTLDTKTIYQHFFLSIHSISTSLNYCLHHHIDELLRVVKLSSLRPCASASASAGASGST